MPASLATDYQKLAYVARVTGHAVRLGLLETVLATKLTDTQIIVTIQRAETHSTTSGLRVKRYGMTMYSFVNRSGYWEKQDPITSWDEPTREVHVTVYVPPEERAAQREWEDLCHRPGTSASPLDNADRRFQQEVLGY